MKRQGFPPRQTRVPGVFGQDIIWLMVCAFILTSAMTKADLAQRIARAMVVSFGMRTRGRGPFPCCKPA
jgi:di/tricarboxylate transporter